MTEPLTLHPTPATPTDAGPWTYAAVDASFIRRPALSPLRCTCCHAAEEDTYYLDPHGDPVCAACATACPYCYERPAVVSARRSGSDPTAPGMVDHVCEECLNAHWDPCETLVGAYLCPECDLYHLAEEDCCACHGDGWLECDDEDGNASATYCGCPKGEQLSAEAERESAWMIPHVRRALAAERCGDTDEAERIKHDVLRHDSPHDPMNRRVS